VRDAAAPARVTAGALAVVLVLAHLLARAVGPRAVARPRGRRAALVCGDPLLRRLEGLADCRARLAAAAALAALAVTPRASSLLELLEHLVRDASALARLTAGALLALLRLLAISPLDAAHPVSCWYESSRGTSRALDFWFRARWSRTCHY